MKYLLSGICVLFHFVVAAQSVHNLPTKEEWVHTITQNKIEAAPAKKKFLQAPAGPALYFIKCGQIEVPYIVYVPKGYNPSVSYKMVVYLHNSPLLLDSFQQENPVVAKEPIFSIADTFNVIVLFPFGRGNFFWQVQQAAIDNVIEIIKKTEKYYNVDRHKIYIGGQGDGGFVTYWYIMHKPELFAGFYTFGAFPKYRIETIDFKNITKRKPLYTLNVRDDKILPYPRVKAIYEQHKEEAPGWHFETIDTGGHRFIFKEGGKRYVKSLIGQLLTETSK